MKTDSLQFTPFLLKQDSSHSTHFKIFFFQDWPWANICCQSVFLLLLLPKAPNTWLCILVTGPSSCAMTSTDLRKPVCALGAWDPQGRGNFHRMPCWGAQHWILWEAPWSLWVVAEPQGGWRVSWCCRPISVHIRVTSEFYFGDLWVKRFPEFFYHKGARQLLAL